MKVKTFSVLKVNSYILRVHWVKYFKRIYFVQCSPGTVETQRLYPLRQGPQRAIKDGFFGLINHYLFFQSRVRTEFLYLSLIGIILKWGFLIWELIFIHCGLLLSLRFGQISPLAFFRLFTATSDRNAEFCNRIPSNYCLP